jgi:transcriptional repressor NrdR
MRCPKCTSIEDKVIDSRISKEGSTIRRRRECLVVIKRDGRREDFDREKLFRAIRAALHKRPVDREQLDMLIEDVIDALEAQYDSEIPSQAVGDAVMQRLRKLDQVAYVRFASVYKEFRDVSEFMHEISNLGKPHPEKH